MYRDVSIFVRDSNLCLYIAVNKEVLKVHVRSVHEIIKFPCSECAKVFTQHASLETHINSIHNYRCDQCEYRATRQNKL